jgi:DNA-binding transcriptional MerR regulator
MPSPRTSNLPELLESIPSDGIGLDELASLASQLLEARHVVMRDGRAAERVVARTVRFYQTLGIVPKPGYEGRRAIYEREHLVRVVAAKLLQAEGYSLAQIQSALPMRTTGELLQALLQLDAGDAARTAPSPPSRPRPQAPTALASFQLAPGVTVLIDPTLIADPDRVAETIARSLAAYDVRLTEPRGGKDASSSAAPGEPTHARPHGGNR